MVWGW